MGCPLSDVNVRQRTSAVGTRRIRFSVAFSTACLEYSRGKICSRRPHRRQVAVMRTVLIARFSRIIHCARIVPIAHVQHHAHRRPAQLQKIARAVGRRIHRKCAAAGFERSDIQLLLRCFIHYPRERMFTEVVVKLTPGPLGGVRALAAFSSLRTLPRESSATACSAAARWHAQTTPEAPGYWAHQRARPPGCRALPF